MPKSKNVSGGKTKHMKKGGKEQEKERVVRNVSETPVPSDYHTEDGVYIGVVIKVLGDRRYHVRQVEAKSVREDVKIVKQLKSNTTKGKIDIPMLLLCAERTYTSTTDKISDVVYIYAPEEIKYMKQFGIIHSNYEAFIDEALKAKMLAEGSDASKVDTGFDFDTKLEEDEFEKI